MRLICGGLGTNLIGLSYRLLLNQPDGPDILPSGSFREAHTLFDDACEVDDRFIYFLELLASSRFRWS